MTNVIEFYVPARVQRKARRASPGQTAKLIPFPLQRPTPAPPADSWFDELVASCSHQSWPKRLIVPAFRPKLVRS